MPRLKWAAAKSPFELDRVAIAGCGLVQKPLFPKNNTQVEIGRRATRTQQQALANIRDRQVEPADLLRQQPKAMPGVGMAGVRLQDLAIKLLRR